MASGGQDAIQYERNAKSRLAGAEGRRWCESRVARRAIA